MRVLILNYEYPPLGGGAGTACKYLVQQLAARDGFHVDLITSSTGADRVERLSARAAVHFLDIGKSGSIHYQSQADLLVYAFRSFAYARRLLRRRRYDVVHAFFGIPCGMTAMQLGLPYIVSLRGSDVPFYNRRFEKLDKLVFQRVSRTVWKRASYVVANSAGLRDLALASAPKQPIEVIPNGVDTDFFSPPPKKRRNTALTLVSTGRLIERKGYGYLIEALRGMKRVHLQLVGDGNLNESLIAAAADAGVSVDFMGAKSRAEVVSILQDADLFVLPSLNEGMSNSLLEAMACGLPAVVTDVGGSAELVADAVNGAVVPKADAAALRRAIDVYLANPKLAVLHGNASRRTALTMSTSANAEKYVTFYRNARGGKDEP